MGHRKITVRSGWRTTCSAPDEYGGKGEVMAEQSRWEDEIIAKGFLQPSFVNRQHNDDDERERERDSYSIDRTPFSKLKAYERLSAQSISELAAGSFKAALF
jgi:hypothetical protein